jgi:ABC-type branched-subunit amino acid transport system ATPase component
VDKAFGGVRALRDVWLSARRGEITGLIGPNGSGKSTLFNVIAGVVESDAGEVLLDGRRLDTSRPDIVARQGLVRTFQIPRVAGRMTALQNLMVCPRDQQAERVSRVLSPWRRLAIRLENDRLLDDCWAMLDTIGLTRVANDYASTLSGGQLKLLSIGMALMAAPRILLLDEPTAGINPVLTRRLMEVLATMSAGGLTILVIEHNIDLIAELCSEVHVLDAGAVIASGRPDEVRRDRQVISAYLGLSEARE